MKHLSLVITTMVVALCMPYFAFGLGVSPLTLTYAGGTGSGQSTSTYVENVWSYQYQYHVFLLSGDIPQGALFTQLQVEERDGKSGLAYAKMSLSGKTYSIDFGDNVASFSELTLSNLNYQGTSIMLKPTSDISMTVLGGSRGNGLWGADVRRDTRAKENFTGARITYNSSANFGINTTYLTTPGGQDVLAYGGEYYFGEFKLGAEAGSAVDGKATRTELAYQNDWMTLGTIYRDIDPTYVVPFDTVSYKGMKGTYTSLGIKPSRNLSVNFQNNAYYDRFRCTPEAYNFDTRGDITYNLSTGTYLGYSGWKNDRSSYDRGGITEGEMMYISQQFYMITRNAIYYRYQPTWFDSMNSSEESYSEQKNVAGINISLFDFAHLNYEIENAEKVFRSTDIVLNPSAVSARMDLFENQIMGSAFYIASSINYRSELPDKDVSAEATSTSVYSDVTLKYIPGPDLSCYITAKAFKMESPDDDRTAREQKDLSFGLNYSFNTNFYLK